MKLRFWFSEKDSVDCQVDYDSLTVFLYENEDEWVEEDNVGTTRKAINMKLVRFIEVI